MKECTVDCFEIAHIFSPDDSIKKKEQTVVVYCLSFARLLDNLYTPFLECVNSRSRFVPRPVQ